MKNLFFIFLLILSFNSIAQTCSSRIEKSSPTSSFVLHSDGTATDITTGLMWMRCSLGQKWNGQTCLEDENRVNYYSIYFLPIITSGFSYAGHSDWRVPDIKELESIVEISCYNPAINQDIFPETESTYFLSDSFISLHQNRAIEFNHGVISHSVSSVSPKTRVRLVRDL